ncbi:Outer membrane protein assembly factor YaeT [hydrothermal vent metagenome]|uniref:Outer membrane protein assembly factor YaeT n=1 Tax=hydrothermal vent metagenome TaxID=652676 RepID=A0A3B0RPZ3_9ZZZZ
MPRFGLHILVAIVFCTFATAMPLMVRAQTAAQATEPKTQSRIRQVIVQGNQRLEVGTVQSYLLLGPGDIFDPQLIDLSLKTLFATGLFADISIREQNGALVVEVVENPIINRVIFEGNRALKEEKLRDEIQAQPRAIFTRARVQSDVQRVIELYRKSGRFAATVAPKIAEQPQNRVDLIFEVTEGPVTNVSRINFIGNIIFTDSELRRILATEESRWWKFLTSNDNFDPDRLEYDRELLRQHYGDKGYADFRVVSAVAELTPDRENFFITFTIDEGIKYKFGKVTVESELDALDTDFMERLVPIKSGTLYKNKQIENAIDSLTFAAGASGYAFVDIRDRRNRNRDDRTVDINFLLNEGPRVYVERIEIVGNTRTVDRVIRREIQLVEGDAFNRALLDRSRNLIRRLGFFKEVEVSEQPGSKNDRAVVKFTVEEQPTGELSFGAGFSSISNLLLDVSISERNFRGRGQSLRFAVSASSRRRSVDIRFTEPRFLGRNMSAGFDLFNVRSNFLREASFQTTSLGGGVNVGLPITGNSSLFLRYTLRNDTITAPNRIQTDVFGNPVRDANGDFVVECTASDQICSQIGSRLTSLGGLTFSWDKRNDPIRPTRGFDVSFNQEFAGFGGDVRFLRTRIRGNAFRGLIKDFILSAHIDAGFITGWGGNDIRINDRFFKGGLSFRGFDVAGIGSRIIELSTDLNGQTIEIPRNALGGKAYAIGSFELEFPVGLPEEYGIKASLFTEFGTLGLLDASDKVVSDPSRFVVRDELALRASAGISIFWNSPFGPVKFDFSNVIRKESYDDVKTFRFSQTKRF